MYFGFERITVSYGKHAVLSDVTLEVPRGSITVLIGRNGCGKSSLLKTVSRAVKPKAGRVILEGRSLMAYTPRQLAKRIAYLGQAVPMPSDIDVETLVSYGRYPHTAPGRGITAHDRDVIDRVLRQTGLEAIRNRTLTTLSGGELQRARIAMNLAQEPSVLILDEPTTHLDLGYQLELLELLRRLKGLQAHVNLIPLNHVEESPLKPSSRKAVAAFQKILEDGGITATVRRTLGGDIDASCGQLRRKYQQGK